MRDALRLAFGTLTVLPVRPPARVDRGVAGWAMASGPLVGAVLGVVGVAAAWAFGAVLAPLPVAVLVVGLLALSTRLIHWDGLADTADGLGSGRPPEAALDVMRRSDIGPFGVFAVVTVFALQAAALADLLAPAPGAVGAVAVAVVLGRSALLAGCRSGVPAARPDGLGAAVAGSLGVLQLAAGAGLAAVVITAAVVLDERLAPAQVVVAAGLAALWAVAGTSYLRHRLGGMTGDTLGALVETTTAVALVALGAA